MFFVCNVLYYLLCLLLLVGMMIYFLVYYGLLSSIVSLMLLIVYVGAMMILIGYICAVTPNVIFSPLNFSFLSIIMCAVLFLGLASKSINSFKPYMILLSDYFYSSYGVYMFSVVVLMLFVTLLMVTSQFLLPAGPFRSVS